MKNGLPSERSSSRSTSAAGGDSSRIAATCSRTSRARERPQLDPDRPAGSLQLQHAVTQRMAAAQLIAAVADDQRDRLAPRGADKEREEVARRSIGPLKVLHDKHQRPRPGARKPAAPATARTSAPAIPPLPAGPPHHRGSDASSGSNTASSSRTEPSIASSSLPSRWAMSERSAPTTGAYGSSPSPSGRHSPTATVIPRARRVRRARRSAGSSRYPPPRRRAPPSRALRGSASSAASIADSSLRRSTNRGLETRPTIRTSLSPTSGGETKGAHRVEERPAQPRDRRATQRPERPKLT